MPDTAKAKQRANVSYRAGDVIEIYGPCKLVHVGGRGGRFNAFLPAAVKKPRVRRGKRKPLVDETRLR